MAVIENDTVEVPPGIIKANVIDANDHIEDEESPLLPRSDTEPKLKTLTSVGTIIAVLLLGEFISNADATLVMAAAGRISSEFNRLRDASWLSTGYTLGVCAAQPMYGKLSDIYGRKPMLLFSYLLFAMGCVTSGIGSQMRVVIFGRAISGMGGAGIMTISSIIITDIVPKREVATWRAYVNIAMTLGRSLGGPLGGWLSDTIGWRWLFLLQAPFLALAAALVILKLNVEEKKDSISKGNKLAKVDFLGTALLGSSIVAMITLLDQGGKSFPWTSWWTLLLASGGVSLLIAFVLVEAYVAREPIFNLRILRRTNVSTAYIIGALQIAAQLGMMFSVPLYFQVTQRASTTAAGMHLIPAVIGNTLGGLLAGIFIQRTGQFKILLVVAGLVAGISYLLLYVHWNGHSGLWESLFILPGGLGTGIASASSFIAMSSMLPADEIAMATAGYMLIVGFSITAGVTTSNSVLGMEFQRQLKLNLHGPGSEKVIERAMADTNYIAHLSGHLREIVVACYVSGLKHTYLVSLGCSLLASFSGLFIARHQI
ncbi:Major facilitator superfamily domain general substrate transporter [Penicillium cf. griseofulvum]|uniref:Major facilitator superfamily domain general substrate transporter n=1 Tax=Penicillium cf. griseofulvum TaxID=2972120 RepID=A0A9W9J0A5_9EURO|nr:Major facilitator superfamily domain general substrate transporter [Penicillium cf. griseofulvum]KAJ5429039.1 Major facilitator superfamily domain general substrate transporter [Penicillium cf. griseofulvum]